MFNTKIIIHCHWSLVKVVNFFGIILKLHNQNFYRSLVWYRVSYVRTSVPTFQNLAKQNKFQAKTMFTTSETVGLDEWIIDDIQFVFALKKEPI